MNLGYKIKFTLNCVSQICVVWGHRCCPCRGGLNKRKMSQGAVYRSFIWAPKLVTREILCVIHSAIKEYKLMTYGRRLRITKGRRSWRLRCWTGFCVEDPCKYLRSRVQKYPAWHTKAVPNGKCCERYIVPSMVRLMYQLKSVLK